MQVVATDIPEVKLIAPARHRDDRGWLAEAWNRRRCLVAGVDADFVQDNVAFSHRAGTVRGLHFQAPPRAQGKLVWVPRGRIHDVAVDVRRGSPSYGRHVGAELSAESGNLLWIPPGFAHGYCTLAPDTLVIYKLTDFYAPEAERGLLWNDPALGINWPVAESDAILNPRDRGYPGLAGLAPAFRYGSDA
jgi:dTDP-4-dehydrorhamnose 3,5-epimerase